LSITFDAEVESLGAELLFVLNILVKSYETINKINRINCTIELLTNNATSCYIMGVKNVKRAVSFGAFRLKPLSQYLLLKVRNHKADINKPTNRYKTLLYLNF